MAPVILKFNKPRHRQRLAMFDYDQTLVKPKDNRPFPKNENDWMWLQPNVPDILKKYYEDGYGILVFTNQSKPWKQNHITNSIGSLGIPITVAIAFDKAEHKPSRVMFDAVIGDKKWKKDNSFFVGDALGRRGDFANTDKLFAEAIGVAVRSPEEEFSSQVHLQEKDETYYDKIQQMAKRVKKTKGLELVIMVGYPGSGKSTIAESFLDHGYEVIDGDVHKVEKKRMKLIAEALERKQSVVFDATNMTKDKRSMYIDIAKKHSVSVRCIYISTSMEKSMELNLKRPAEKQVPKIAYYKLRKTFEEPSESEGCEILKL
jgi:bifunctional polynucleotide phosphatase/kinase